MTDAYKHASKGQYSLEINTLQKIDRFGIEAVLGRKVLYHGELRRMITAENIVNSYNARKQARINDMEVEWYAANEHLANLLIEVDKKCL